MSRLDSVIRRLQAQRDCLDHVAGLITDVPGPVYDLGLGNGRTYHHLREILPDRDIYAFDRQVAAHPSSVPDNAHLVIGDIEQTLPGVHARTGGRAAIVHTDLGFGVVDIDTVVAGWLSRLLPEEVAPGGYVIANMPLDLTGWETIAPPPPVKAGRYFIYRKPLAD